MMNNILRYRDFIATVQFSEDDEAFVGHVEGINSIVSFEGQSVDELKQAFKDAVESHLEFCKRKGIAEPQKSYTGVFNVHLTPDLHRRVDLVARMTGTTLNGFIQKVVETELHEMETPAFQ